MAIDNGEEFSVNVLGALRILHSAWDKVLNRQLQIVLVMQALNCQTPILRRTSERMSM